MSTSDLPIPDFDHLPLGDVTARIRSLSAPQVDALIAFEEQHGGRAPVLQVLRARREQLDAGATPSGGDAAAIDLQAPPAPGGGSVASPATEGPKINPPSQGDPTNPAQPR
ncbi:hypothetical protein [Quadrisphaera sp. DSM 44207]|uniref:hypothetical protein n=1 Tax=Quadrisphaera sp. DSM 44207 TaxID=1881057 RepID=UPI00087EC203|nr:hypothetical protein [Quadrisphaera sp. DSM 44207]SDQ86258.1 hypothetical protein SAMN05428996_2935 [Quadrisphaera sp. DSM 44207]